MALASKVTCSCSRQFAGAPLCAQSRSSRQPLYLHATTTALLSPGLRTQSYSRPSFPGPSLNQPLRSRHSARGANLVVRAESDYYKILGVDRGADKKAIKSAYRQLARKFHPDVNKVLRVQCVHSLDAPDMILHTRVPAFDIPCVSNVKLCHGLFRTRVRKISSKKFRTHTKF